MTEELETEARERSRDEFEAGHTNDALFHSNIADALAALRARVADLGADVQWMTENRNNWQDSATQRAFKITKLEAELSRRGQGVQVKPLVWPDFREGGTCGHPHHFQYFVTQDHHGVFWAHFDMSQHRTLEAAQQHCERHYQRAALVSPGDGWRSMDSAPKDRTPILAQIRSDLATVKPNYGFGGPGEYAGRFVVIHHPGLAEDGFDIGWSLSGPFGHGLGSDDVFSGWQPLPAPPASEGA